MAHNKTQITNQEATMWGPGKSCLKVRNLDDVDRKIPAQLIKVSVAHMHQKCPDSKVQGDLERSPLDH